MATMLDAWISDYAVNVPVTNGTPWQGPMIPLYGAAGLLAQCKALGGAAGTLSVYFTNFDGAIGLLDAKGYPPQDTATTASIAANGIGSASAQTYANKCWIVFTPSASGTIYIAVNVRRIAA